jgi:hypothetical protein
MKIRKTIAAVVLGVVGLLLTGCLDTEATFTANSDATVDGKMTITMSKELAGMFGIANKDDFQNQLLDPEISDLPEGQSFSVTEKDGNYKMEVTYENTPLDDGDLKLEITSDDLLKFTYRNEGMGESVVGGAGDLEGMEGSLKFTVTFPSDITETSPLQLPESVTIDGNVLRIDSDLAEVIDLEVYSTRGGVPESDGQNDQEAELYATAGEDNDDGSSKTWIVFLGIGAATLLLVGVAYLVVRRRTMDIPTE